MNFKNKDTFLDLMRLGILFSGGKDSAYALLKAKKYHKIACLINIQSENKESYMYHTPNIEWCKLQADAMNIPILTISTKGNKEDELKELKEIIQKAKDFFYIEGIVTGAIESVYQATRIQKICDDLELWCFNPLWQIDQLKLLNELIQNKFEVLIVGVFGYPFDEKWLGRKIDNKTIKDLAALKEKYKINPSGEGGEIETFVTNAPFFNNRIIIKKSKITYSKNAGVFKIKEAILK